MPGFFMASNGYSPTVIRGSAVNDISHNEKLKNYSLLSISVHRTPRKPDIFTGSD